VNYKSLIAIPVLLLAVMLQVSAGSHIKLMMGSVDLLLVILVAWGLQNVPDSWLWAVLGGLMLSLVSAMPFPSLLLIVYWRNDGSSLGFNSYVAITLLDHVIGYLYH